MKRPSWHQYFMTLAGQVSSMSTCASGRKVGAVFVKDKRIVATGFNGVPSKYPHPNTCARRDSGVESGCGLDLCVCAHAEQNCIADAARRGVALEGCSVYVTCKPCSSCAGLIVNSGVKEVYYEKEYNSPRTEEIFKYGSVKLLPLNRENTWV